MARTKEEVFAAALALERTAKIKLIKLLLESLSKDDEALEPDWLDEMQSRITAFEAGSLKTEDGPKLLAKLRRRNQG